MSRMSCRSFSVLSHGVWAEPIAYAIAVAGLIGASLGLIALLQMSRHAREALLELCRNLDRGGNPAATPLLYRLFLSASLAATHA